MTKEQYDVISIQTEKAFNYLHRKGFEHVATFVPSGYGEACLSKYSFSGVDNRSRYYVKSHYPAAMIEFVSDKSLADEKSRRADDFKKKYGKDISGTKSSAPKRRVKHQKTKDGVKPVGSSNDDLIKNAVALAKHMRDFVGKNKCISMNVDCFGHTSILVEESVLYGKEVYCSPAMNGRFRLEHHVDGMIISAYCNADQLSKFVRK